MINAHRLTAFIAVARTGSFTQAAAQLSYSTSAVSQQVSALERYLGVQLLERDPSGVRPTAAGELLLERGGDVLASLDEVENEMRRLAADDGGLHLPEATPPMVQRAKASYVLMVLDGQTSTQESSLCAMLARTVVESANADRAVVSVLTTEGLLQEVSSSGRPGAALNLLADRAFQLDDYPLTKSCIEERRSALVSVDETDHPEEAGVLDAIGQRHVIITPLHLVDGPYGIVEAYWTGRAGPGPDAMGSIELLARHGGRMLSHLRAGTYGAAVYAQLSAMAAGVE